MARRKVRLHYVANEISRRTTFRKRKKGLLKKVGEITTLCDIKAAVIIYSPFDGEPEVFPSLPEVNELLTKFRDMPQMDKTRKMVDQETFLIQRIYKVREQIRKLKRDNREKEITQVMFGCLKGRTLSDLEMKDLQDLNFIIERNLRELEIKQRAADEQKQEENQENQLNQVQAESIAVELGLTTRNAFGEGTSRGVQQQHHQPAMEAQSMEQWQYQMMQVAAQRQQHQQLFQQQPWFLDIMNPPPPQMRDFLHPLPPLQRGGFRDYNSDNATCPNNSSFRFP
ncbi:agamous-like MADS-box protein AGL80 [Rosa rugosa]|uniref:agamous-like MADS-box protein AGL80 n=1 Tax=Rosa rugosa TaxID=74645 RepID=UPI002B401C87|nr:agamous-like MADS-box protein AGL80 [Rosa rugosa]